MKQFFAQDVDNLDSTEIIPLARSIRVAEPSIQSSSESGPEPEFLKQNLKVDDDTIPSVSVNEPSKTEKKRNRIATHLNPTELLNVQALEEVPVKAFMFADHFLNS